MPFKLSSAQSKTITIDTLEINSFAADVERQEIHVSYDEGYMDANNVFVPVNKDRMLTLAGQDYLDSIALSDAKANAMPAGQVSVYGAIKLALYDKLSEVTGIMGTVI